MFNVQFSIIIGWVCDLVFGDPQRLPHPIVWFGKVIAFFEHRLNHGSHRQLKGALMSITLILGTFALSGGFEWKGLTVDMMFQGVAGNKIAYVGKQMILSDVEGNFNRSAEILSAWSPSNTGSKIPRLSKNDPNGNFSTPSDYYIEDGSYLRLKNLTIGYDLTKVLRQIPHFAGRNSSCRVYVSGENLFTITKYSGMDPEMGGYDTIKYPVSRVFAFGIKLNY